MSKFINTEYKDTINSIVDGFKERLKNPYYVYNDKKATIVTYYNRNVTKSTLDEGAFIEYSALGGNSPIRYNKITDAYLYGIDRISIDLDNGDYGAEANDIEGEAIVLPNTFIPYAGDYFSIPYANKNILFKIIGVTPDTLDNGANIYKLQYKLDRTDYEEERINKQVVKNFKMIINNVGTNFKAVIEANDYEFIEELQEITNTLKQYYKSLFFKNKVQTFVFSIGDDNFYDPYMIEFLMKHRILQGEEYTFVEHQTVPSATFPIEYDKTFFKALEICSTKGYSNRSVKGVYINDPNSLLSTRYEDYFELTYTLDNMIGYPITTVDDEVLYNINNNIKYDESDSKAAYNILVMYFNKQPFDGNVLDYIEKIEYQPSKELFYLIPIVIFILENYITNVLK